MTTARQIIQLSLEGINVIGAGETISADLADFCLRQLNAIADRMSAGRGDLFKDQLVSGTVSGTTLTTGTGAFASVSAGQEIQGMLADNYPMAQITIEQYRDIFNKTASGRPQNYAYDGFNTIYLYPVATNNVMTIQCRQDIQQFADLDSDYGFPSGYLSAFSACLAVAVAPSLLGGATQDMMKKEMAAMQAIQGGNIRPLILGGDPINVGHRGGNIINGFR